MKEYDPQAEVWSYCWRIPDKDTVVCKLCHCQVNDSDTAIWRHMRQKHRDAYRRTRHYKHRAGVSKAQKLLPTTIRPEQLGSSLLLCDLQRKNWSDLGAFDEKHLDTIKIWHFEESCPDVKMDSDTQSASNNEKCAFETFPQCTAEISEEDVILDFEIVVENFSLEDAMLDSGPPKNDAEESNRQLTVKHGEAKAKGDLKEADAGRGKGQWKLPLFNKKRTHKHGELEEDDDDLFFRMMRKNFKKMDKAVKKDAVAKLKEVLADVGCESHMLQ